MYAINHIYGTGYWIIVELFPNPSMWDYSNIPLNYKCIICAQFMIAWFALSLVAIFVADGINYLVLNLFIHHK